MGRGFFDFRSMEEKNRDYKLFLKRVFPRGKEQKEQVRRLLKEGMPEEDVTYLMMCYVAIKDYMVVNDETSFSWAAHQVLDRMNVIKVTPKLLEVLRGVMELDMDMDE